MLETVGKDRVSLPPRNQVTWPILVDARMTISSHFPAWEAMLYKVDFHVTNGQTIRPKYAIKFKVKIQNHGIEITTLSIDSLGTLDMILGTKRLSELDSSLDFIKNTLHFKSRSILLKANKKITLLSGETKTIELVGQLPSFLRNSDLHIK